MNVGNTFGNRFGNKVGDIRPVGRWKGEEVNINEPKKAHILYRFSRVSVMTCPGGRGSGGGRRPAVPEIHGALDTMAGCFPIRTANGTANGGACV